MADPNPPLPPAGGMPALVAKTERLKRVSVAVLRFLYPVFWIAGVVLAASLCVKLVQNRLAAPPDRGEAFAISLDDTRIVRTPCKERGSCLEVPLPAKAGKQIKAVAFDCDGLACDFIRACPNGGYCGPKFVTSFDAQAAKWYGWSNARDSLSGVLTFTIRYEPVPPGIDSPTPRPVK